MVGLEFALSDVHPRFMGYSLNQKVDDILVGLTLDGFDLDQEASSIESGTFVFHGPFYGEQVDLYVFFSSQDHVISSIMVAFENDSDLWTLLSVQYGLIKMKVEARYGKPTFSDEKFVEPYKEGDGYELMAFESKNASWLNLYDIEGGTVSLSILTDNGKMRVCLGITDTKNDVE